MVREEVHAWLSSRQELPRKKGAERTEEGEGGTGKWNA